MCYTEIMILALTSWGWLIWAIFVAISFGVFEWIGLRKQEDKDIPLTEAIQRLTGKKGWKRDLGVAILVGFTGWFIFHLWL